MNRVAIVVLSGMYLLTFVIWQKVKWKKNRERKQGSRSLRAKCCVPMKVE
jgi:hypothetical protein